MYRITLVSCLTFAALIPGFAQTNFVRPVPVPPSAPPTVVVPPATVVAPSAAPAPALVWDADTKEYAAKVGDTSAPFIFNFTNKSSAEVVISNATTSCGCTVAQLPMQPWPIAPGSNGQINVTMNLAGKQGRVTKQVNVYSSEGTKSLLVVVDVPATPAPSAENQQGNRNANMAMAKADRQAVFKGDCASCHVTKGVGKMGAELYVADCAICHDSPHRAAFVPDLRAPKGPRDLDFWVTWITYGRQGSMMPAFAASESGPLTPEQINSLAAYLSETFPKSPVAIPFRTIGQ